MSQPRTHQERSEQVASVLLLRTDLYVHPETGDQKTAAELIARETFPEELVQAARNAHARLCRAVCGWPYTPIGTHHQQCRDLCTALALYPEPKKETP